MGMPFQLRSRPPHPAMSQYQPKPRKTLQRFNIEGDAHFLTFSCFKRQPFLKSDRSLNWLGDSVTRACLLHEYHLWGYVFMPEHVHLLVKPIPTDYDVSRFLLSIKESVTRKAIGYRNTSGKPEHVWEPFLDIHDSGKVHFRFWQRGAGYDRNLWNAEEIREKLNYMHNNPVKRELCQTPLDWQWSSARYYETGEEGPIKVATAPI
jgi:putative transposase